MTQEQNSDKHRSPDRVLQLKIIDGTLPKTSTGLLDSRLFTKGNNLHAIQNSETTLWALRYDQGVLPQQLKQNFTSFKKLLQYVEVYLKGRNVEVAEIKD